MSGEFGVLGNSWNLSLCSANHFWTISAVWHDAFILQKGGTSVREYHCHEGMYLVSSTAQVHGRVKSGSHECEHDPGFLSRILVKVLHSCHCLVFVPQWVQVPSFTQVNDIQIPNCSYGAAKNEIHQTRQPSSISPGPVPTLAWPEGIISCELGLAWTLRMACSYVAPIFGRVWYTVLWYITPITSIKTICSLPQQ